MLLVRYPHIYETHTGCQLCEDINFSLGVNGGGPPIEAPCLGFFQSTLRALHVTTELSCL